MDLVDLILLAVAAGAAVSSVKIGSLAERIG